MKPHRTDMISLIFAVIFLAIVSWWVFAQIVNVNVPAAGWWVAFGLILLGLLGLIGAIRTARTAGQAAAPAAVAFGSHGPLDPVDPVDPVDPLDPEPTSFGSPAVGLEEPVSSPPRGQIRD